jgi:hypothetical protein
LSMQHWNCAPKSPQERHENHGLAFHSSNVHIVGLSLPNRQFIWPLPVARIAPAARHLNPCATGRLPAKDTELELRSSQSGIYGDGRGSGHLIQRGDKPGNQMTEAGDKPGLFDHGRVGMNGGWLARCSKSKSNRLSPKRKIESGRVPCAGNPRHRSHRRMRSEMRSNSNYGQTC